MRRAMTGSTIALLALAISAPLTAQKTTETAKGRVSPHVKTEWTIDGANIAIEYGRPYLKGREEATMMPPGKPWRTGADEATLLTTDKPLQFGTLKLEPGTYTLNTVPGEKEWQLLVGTPAAPTERRPKQWGIPYQEKLEIGRAPMTVAKTKEPVEQVTISVDDTPAGGTLRIEWGTASASIPFTVG